MTGQFRKGDRVRAIVSGSFTSVKPGDEGTIQDIYSGNNWVLFDGLTTLRPMWDYELILVRAAPLPQITDGGENK